MPSRLSSLVMLATRNDSSTVKNISIIKPHQRQRPVPHAPQILREQDAGRNHGHGDGKAVGRLHVRRGFEPQLHGHAAGPQHPVDAGHVNLPALVGGEQNAHLGPEIQANRLGDKRVGARNECLRGDNSRHRGQQNERQHGPGGCNEEERVLVATYGACPQTAWPRRPARSS